MIKAVNKYIIVKLEYAEKTKFGIYIPDQAKQYSGEFTGVVVSIGNLVSRHKRADLKPGDRIIFRKLEGFKINDGEYLAVRERWVVCKLKEEAGNNC